MKDESKRLISRIGGFSKERTSKTKKSALKLLRKANNFIVIVNTNGHNTAISAIESDAVLQMAFNCKRLEKELFMSMKQVLELDITEGLNNDSNF